MSLPGFNEPFHQYYNNFSIDIRSLKIPNHFKSVQPENQDDFNCRFIIYPDPLLGAKKWTINGRWITIGIYRDEGREPAQKPIKGSLNWSRVGTELTITDTDPHMLFIGDLIDLYNTNESQSLNLSIVKVIDEFRFIVNVNDIGDLNGVNGAYQPSLETNFYEQNCVFRLLPSFKLVPIQLIFQLFDDTSPLTYSSRRELFDITLNDVVKIPNISSKSVNFELPRASSSFISIKNPLNVRFDQVYDENGNPMPLKYDLGGNVIIPNRVDSKYKNEKLNFNQPMINEPIEGIDDPSLDQRVYAFDFYGLDINDPSRGPYFSSDIITRDLDKDSLKNNIKRKTNSNDIVLYSGKIFDIFGNFAVGIQETNSLLTRNLILPLSLDAFNKPIKT